MAMLTRIFQLVEADIHGVMDQIEDQGLLLKQHLRDMEESLAQKEAKLKQMCFARDQARQDYEKGIKESNNLEQDLEVAIRKDRDDIARILIKKIKPLAHIQSERCSHIDRLNHCLVRGLALDPDNRFGTRVEWLAAWDGLHDSLRTGNRLSRWERAVVQGFDAMARMLRRS